MSEHVPASTRTGGRRPSPPAVHRLFLLLVGLIGIVCTALPFLPISGLGTVFLREAALVTVALQGVWVWRVQSDIRRDYPEAPGLPAAHAGALSVLLLPFGPLVATLSFSSLLRGIAHQTAQAVPEAASRLAALAAGASRLSLMALPWSVVLVVFGFACQSAILEAGGSQPFVFERRHGLTVALGVSAILGAGAAQYGIWLSRAIPSLYRILAQHPPSRPDGSA